MDERTFNELFGFIYNRIYMDEYTAKQIDEIMQLCYEQHNRGYDQCERENGINSK